jgi:HK97 family phage major capsid protein
VKKSDELKQKIADATDRAEAIVNLAKDDKGNDRSLSADESKSWKAIMDEKDGELAKLNAELKAALAYEAEVARLQAARAALATPVQPVFNPTGAGPAVPAVPTNARIITPTLRAFKGADAARDAYDCGLWFIANALRGSKPALANDCREKAIARRGMEWFATQNEGTPADGGYLVPTQFENAVIVYREQVGVARKLARVVQMTSDNWVSMKQTSGTTVYYPGEETAITASDANFARYSLTAKKRAILAYVSSELNADSAVSIMDLLASDMGHQFALKEDQEFIAGDGTSTYGSVTGVRPAVIAATAGVYSPIADEDAWEELTTATHLATMALVADKYRGGTLSWVCSQSYKWQVMDRLAIAQGGAGAFDLVGGQMVPRFLGYPVITTDRMPTTTAVSQVSALFGNFSDAAIIGDRSGLEVKLSEHVAFTTDQIAVRGTTRYDIHVHEEGNTSTAGAIVGLETHS